MIYSSIYIKSFITHVPAVIMTGCTGFKQKSQQLNLKENKSNALIGACIDNLTPVPEAEYSTKIIGSWQGTVGDSKETMSINSDGTFVCNLHATFRRVRTLW